MKNTTQSDITKCVRRVYADNAQALRAYINGVTHDVTIDVGVSVTPQGDYLYHPPLLAAVARRIAFELSRRGEVNVMQRDDIVSMRPVIAIRVRRPINIIRSMNL